MSVYALGYIGTSGNLWRAMRTDPRVQLVEVDPAGPIPTNLQAIVMETPPSQHAGLLHAVARCGDLPILTDMPAAGTVAECQVLLDQLGSGRVWSANPLVADPAFGRMAEHYGGSDLLRTVFASARVAAGSAWRDDLARLVDLAASLTQSKPVRISPLAHASGEFALAIVRYANGVVMSLEAGALIPAETGRQSDLLIECFGDETAYRYAPADQALTLEGQSFRRIDWSPNPAVRSLTNFLAALEEGAHPGRGLEQDIDALAISERILLSSDGAQVEATT